MTANNILDDIKTMVMNGKRIPLSTSVMIDERKFMPLMAAITQELSLRQQTGASAENAQEHFREGVEALSVLAELGKEIASAKKVSMTDHAIIDQKKILRLVERLRMEMTLLAECA